MNARLLTVWSRLTRIHQTARRLATSKTPVPDARQGGARRDRVHLTWTKFMGAPPQRAPPGGRSSRCEKAPSAGTRHPPSGHFARPGKRSPGQGSGAAGRCPTRRPAGLRRGITCQPTQLEGPSQLLLQPAAPWARGASTSRCFRRRRSPYLISAPNKNLRGRKQAGT